MSHSAPRLYLNLYHIFRDYYFTFSLTQGVFIDIIYRIDHTKTYNYNAPTLVPILKKSRPKCAITLVLLRSQNPQDSDFWREREGERENPGNEVESDEDLELLPTVARRPAD